MGEAKTIATKPLQSFFIYVSSQVVFRENSNNLVVVGYVLTYPGNKYDNNCFFGSLPGILPTDITPISQAGSIRRRRTIYPDTDFKKGILVLLSTELCVLLRLRV